METKNRKMKIVLFISYVMAGILISMVIRLRKNNNKDFHEIYKKMDVLFDVVSNNYKFQDILHKEHIQYKVLLHKIYIALELLGLSSTPSIRKTTFFVFDQKKEVSIREASIELLNNLIEEYSKYIDDIKIRITSSNDNEEKEKLSTLVEEFNNLVTLISTVSPDSSEEYVKQIYAEISVGINKIRNV